ncbi:hypothetical protein [Carboxylicivirga sp. M1479]|uniref:hypothetical protein n=1 Tax=Carboxylicivirga sp. M1479 TaxID=2594476 RepID=UPI001177A1DF|nr:hypothetical protein [Carboxylicivirga sp. M1479]TRX71633.1 hypothetical protein FNN09_05185 [Carboxylicivirga sp. M1479]
MKKVLLSLAVIAALSACDKNDQLIEEMPLADIELKSTTESVVTTEASLDDLAEAAEYEVDLFTGTDEAMATIAAEQDGIELKAGGEGSKKRYRDRYKWGKCPDIHIVKEEGGWPRTITLNYGESTELENGRVISGIIEIYQTASRKVNGATRTVTFKEFSVDAVGIAGTSEKTFKKDEFKVDIVRDLTFTLEDGTTIHREAVRVRTWTQGMDTPLDHTDDIFEITGSVTCVDSDENEYSRLITTPLIKKGGCRYIVAGEVTLSSTKNGVDFATINYGDGECDNIAIMTTAEGSEEIEIGKRKRERRQERNQNGQ